jgi:hypothetical protein
MDLRREEIVCSEQELKAREPYMCPEQAQMEEAELRETMKANFSDKPLELNCGDVNNYSAIFHKIQKAPDVQLPQKLNDGDANNYSAIFQRIQRASDVQLPRELNDGDVNNYSAIFQRIQRAPDVQLQRELNDGDVNNYSAIFQWIQKNPVGHIPQRKFRWVKKLDLGGPGVYNTCDCRRRNGLQDDCRLTLCHGRPECLTDPPTCVHSQGIWYD